MTAAILVLGILALLGHLMFWVGVFNKVHATALPYKVIKLFEKLIYLIVTLVPFAMVLLLARMDLESLTFDTLMTTHPAMMLYLSLCWGILAVGTPVWVLQRLASEPKQLLARSVTVHQVRGADGQPPLGDSKGRMFARIPGNEIFQLNVEEKTLELERLPPVLDGLTIAHLSDLHFTGHVDRSFFEFVVDRTCDLKADLIVITGDIVDKAECIPWVRPLFSRLKAPHGTYCILGNHDKRLQDVPRLRSEIVAAGVADIGGKTASIQIHDQTILLAGNELPWFGPAPDVSSCPVATSNATPLRILLSHSPDQFDWGRQYEFDLIVAGHTHGGQIRLPLLGPIVSPSRFGVKYASGVFAASSSVMHVSRGLSGLDPIRFNCPPELAKLVLRSKTASQRRC